MSKQDLLVEIGFEEIPARFVTDAMNQLSEKVKKWFNSNKFLLIQCKPFQLQEDLLFLFVMLMINKMNRRRS